MDSNVLKAILAMDAYNRGHNAGIQLQGSNLGSVTILSDSLVLGDTTDENGNVVRLDEYYGFYGMAYQMDGGGTVVSYRGTDQAPDLFAALESGDLSKFLTPDVMNGYGLGAGSPTTAAKQAELAIKFYHDVAGNEADWRSANVSFTGHSLGGGLAGFVGALYNRTGILFNNMAYQKAADNAYLYSTDHVDGFVNPVTGLIEFYNVDANASLKELIYGSGEAVPANYLNFNTVYMDGDFLAINRSAQTGGKIEANLGPDVSSLSGTQYHSMATMVMQLYANTTVESRDWESAAKYFWPIMYDNDFARDIGMTSSIVAGRDQTNQEYAGILRQILAYSAIDEGATVDAKGKETNARPFGDTGIRAFYNDANDLGKALSSADVSANLVAHASDISKAFVQYAGELALNKVVLSTGEHGNGAVLDGVLAYEGNVLTVDFSDQIWGLIGAAHNITPQYTLTKGLLGDIGDSYVRDAMQELWGNSSSNIFEKISFAATENGSFYLSDPASLDKAQIFIGGNGTSGITYIEGSSGNDLLIGGYGVDHINGGAGNDILIGGGLANNLLSGGDGFDLVTYQNESFGIVYDNGLVTRLSGTDALNGIESIIGTNSNDTVDLSGGLQPVILHFDGRSGFDSFKGAMSGFYDETTGKYYQAGGEVDLKNFENITNTVIMVDVHNARVLEGRVIKPGADTDGVHYSFKASDVGSKIDVIINSGFSSTSVGNGQYDYHITRNIQASYNFGGTVWSGNVLDLDQSFKSSAYSHANNFWQVVSGTNKGDIFNINCDPSGFDGIVTRLAIETGSGNDTINFSQGDYSSFAVGYTGGNDIIHNAGALVNIALSGFSVADMQVTNILLSGGFVTGYKIYFDGGNSITLDGLHLDASGGYIYSFPVNGVSVSLAGGITMGAPAIDGAYVSTENKFYGLPQWSGSEGNDTYHAGAGNNVVDGLGGNDTIYGEQGNDVLDGGQGDDTLYGGAGDDTLYSLEGTNFLSGGDGSDTYVISAGAITRIDDRDSDVISGVGQSGHNTLVVEDLLFYDFEFIPNSDFSMDIIYGGWFQVAYLADYRQFDQFKFGEDDIGLDLNTFLTNVAEKVVTIAYAGDADIVTGALQTEGVTAKYDLGAGDDEFTGSSGREIVVGRVGDDHISGEGGNDTLLGGDGNDRLLGGGGDDELYGGAGEDFLNGGQGKDLISGGDGGDLVNYSDFDILSGVNIDLASGLTSNDGYGTVDTLISIENAQGSRFDDIIRGTDDANVLIGDAGNDVLEGRGGDDFLVGGIGNDTYVFNPGDGEDTIADIGGEDTLRIGGGITYADLTFTQDGNNLYIHIASGVTIRNQFGSNPNAVIEWAEFDDGTRVRLPNPFEVVNRAPVAATDSFTLNEDTVFSGNVLLNDSDPDGDVLLVTAATLVTSAGATVALLADGTFTYSPSANVNGLDSFTYTVSDGHGHETSALVNLTVLAVNDNPVANNDLYAASGSSVTGNVLSNDTDVDGDVLSVASVGEFHTATGALVSLLADGQFVYSAALGYFGNDQFTYTVSDGLGGSSQATVSLSLSAAAGSTMDTQGYNFLLGGKGASTLYGLGGDDYMIGRDGSDKLFGGVGHDTLVGNSGNDLLVGGAGRDTLLGGSGNDTLVGGDVIVVTRSDGSLGYVSTHTDSSDDIFIGGGGDDILIAGGGRDLLYGDGGADTFMFLEADGKTDQIFGFNANQGDKIDLSALLEGYDPVSDAIADFVKVTSSKGQTTISVDTDGGGNSFVDIVSFAGAPKDDLDSMLSKGSLVV